jgi:hypothetical protein
MTRNDRDDLIDSNNNIIIPLSSEVVKSLFGWLSKNTDLPKKWKRRGQARNDNNGIDNDDVSDEEDVDQAVGDAFAINRASISYSCMQGYKSALAWYYRECGDVLIEASLNSWCDDFINGYKKTVADKKSRGVMAITEGKAPLSFSGYNQIGNFLARTVPMNNFNWQLLIFSWSFMVLSWNLIGRANTVGNIMLQHMDWSQDCLKIKLAKHKGDQTGEGIGNEKHVYANPYNPAICPILVLAVYLYNTAS